MPLHLSGVLTARQRRLAAISGLAVVALLLAAAPSALATTPPNSEVLSGVGQSTGMSGYSPCSQPIFYSRQPHGSMGFSVTGTASGLYPGSFSEIGSVSYYYGGYPNPRWFFGVTGTFTITSGATTLPGSFYSTVADLGGAICDSTGDTGFSASGLPISVDGQSVGGAGTVSGTFYAAAGAQDSVTESWLGLPTNGDIFGSVVDSRTGAPVSGICVRAYNSSGSVVASAQTVSSGAYSLLGVPPGTEPTGSVKVKFSSGCGASGYVRQWYNAQPSRASADPVSVIAGETTTGINAAMVGQAQITGTVTARATRSPLRGICVRAYTTSGALEASTQTSANGTYTIGALPTGSYRVGFIDCTHHAYVKQYYKDKPTLASADPIPLLTATTRSRINAKLVRRGQ